MDPLPSQCLLKIFEYIEYISIKKNLFIYKTLHNCIFVNKQWSSLAISILWRNPLESISSENDDDDDRMISIMKTYLTFISQKSKDSLMKNDLKLPEEILRQASYDYPSHLQILNYQKLYDAISLLIKKYFHKEDNEKIFHQHQLLEHILRMFMNKCRKIYRIDISDVPNSNVIFHFPLLPDSDKCLSNITEFYYKGNRHSEFIYLLSQICTQIKSFRLEDQEYDNQGLAKLLDIQKVPLESLSIGLKTSSTLLIENIIKEKNLDNISRLKLNGSSKLFLSEFKNLKELESIMSFNGCYFLNATFPKLEKFTISNFYMDRDICDFLIIHGIKLKYLYFRGTSINHNMKIMGKLSETLVKYCPNLIEYEGYICVKTKKLRNNHLLVLFKTCTKLEKLHFWGEYASYDINDFLKIASEYIPKDLNTLRLDPYWEFNEESLDVFLNGCKKRLTKKLNLEIPSSRRSPKIDLVLDKYARENVLYEEYIINSAKV
ncbi:hypothetical protein RclHR1_01850017 [Rhizophagus clarus]|uniref:F-box domain-containing protein n=1 Tax=Rhizophagus clarus TaxID=94130 RepID=A0A2Z6QMK0_9GLOM|nr:hypothetical protein RclHR1_01850017 [Rhizophagus clarus]GES92680.1 hypothetical protein GLOIN_2v1598982 [Rhizophagus clarus]